MLNHPSLAVSREEVALETLLKWQKLAPEGLVFQCIKFALFSVASLRSVEELAQSLGPCGVDLQKEVRKGLRAHDRVDALEGEPLLKRRRLQHWRHAKHLQSQTYS